MSQGKPRPAQKKIRKEPSRFLSAGRNGYVSDPKYALGETRQRATPIENIVLEGQEFDPPEVAVPAEDQKWMTVEAKERDAARRQGVPLHERLKVIEEHLRPEQRARLNHHIEAMERAAHEKAA